METVLNGILIVALFFGLGVHLGDNKMIAFAFALAGVSYLVNIARDFEADDVASKMFWLVFGAGVCGYVYVACKLIGWL